MKNEFDSIISIGEVHEHPSISEKIVDKNLIKPYCDSLEMTMRRQDNDSLFLYGVAYIVKKNTLLKENILCTKKHLF